MAFYHCNSLETFLSFLCYWCHATKLHKITLIIITFIIIFVINIHVDFTAYLFVLSLSTLPAFPHVYHF